MYVRSRVWITGLGVCLVAGGCASSNSGSAAPSAGQREGAEAARKSQIAAPVLQGTGQEELSESTLVAKSSPGKWLEAGFRRYQRGDFEAASRAFSSAIHTGKLNPAGRCLAYWHVGMTERELHNEDRCASALSNFLVVAEDILSVRDDKRFAVNEHGDFVSNFKLPQRMADARAYLSALWARRVPHFGHSLENPVPVRNEEEIKRFIGYAPPCSNADDRQVERQTISNGDDARVDRVTVSCEANQKSARYYLYFVPSQESSS